MTYKNDYKLLISVLNPGVVDIKSDTPDAFIWIPRGVGRKRVTKIIKKN